jgi:hypothetical protein
MKLSANNEANRRQIVLGKYFSLHSFKVIGGEGYGPVIYPTF